MDGEATPAQRRWRGQEAEVVKERLFLHPTARAWHAYEQPRHCLPQGAARLTKGASVECNPFLVGHSRISPRIAAQMFLVTHTHGRRPTVAPTSWPLQA